MARLGASKKKKSPRATELSQLKKELQRVTEQLESRDRELDSATEQQSATSDVLGIISRAPTDLQAVFDTIAEHSVKLCGALFSSVYRFDGELIHMVGHHNYSPAAVERSRQLFPTRPGRHLFTARAILDRSVIHVPDVTNDPEHTGRDIMETLRSEACCRYRCYGVTIRLAQLQFGTPMSGRSRRSTWPCFRPLPSRLSSRLRTPAYSRNSRIGPRNSKHPTPNSARHLDQQTATSEILSVIAGSPTDMQPVLDAVAENAARLMRRKGRGDSNRIEANELRSVAHLRDHCRYWGDLNYCQYDRGSSNRPSHN